ncbi:hypothetical protein GDO78_015357 [Eleutherodactylus coqui]|uniref:Sugar phosphate exchanger 3 n=1 Tax=Eleutherodactylus coqui TaxID=57060 RepID=A0A8J6JP78_ELECQ|nr:hypothetical protein GDO78_015357 [Eleutherodactylus coqui]
MDLPVSPRRAAARRGFLAQYTHHHLVVFLLTFFSYALLHASRKAFSNVKVSITNQWTPTDLNSSAYNVAPNATWNDNHLFPNHKSATIFLGLLDTIFLFSYAMGLFISGIVGDRLNMRYVLTFGMCSSAVTVRQDVYSTRGVVFGLWSACASVGNILGAFLASSVLKYGYEYAFLVTASVQFAGGLVIFFGLVTTPKELGLPDAGEEESAEQEEEEANRPLIGGDNEGDSESSYSIQAPDTEVQTKAIGFIQACCLPGVLLYSLAYACLKLVNYSFFFWLPFYLSENFQWKEAEADRLSIWYDIGGIIGGTIQGFISDLMKKRSPVLAISLLLAVGALFGYSRSPNSKPINALLMTITGFFIGGPSNMISSAISADLGRQEMVRGSSEALATVTGIVDGTGSVGAALGQVLVSVIQGALNWIWVFYFFILMTVLTILFIIPLIIREMRPAWRNRRTSRLAG